MKPVGILALQGDFEAHRKAVERAGGRAAEVRTAAELAQVSGLIVPGGESTTMLKLLDSEGLFEALREFGLRRPIFGTCAGAILLAKNVLSPSQLSLELMDIDVERNAYGRQLDSRVVRIEPCGLGGEELEAVFIRAPIIRRAGPGVRVLAAYCGDPVLVDDGRHLAATFHPELSSDTRIHELFLKRVEQ
jgi:5'-phosphate synthase pdxT subunit